MVSGVHLADPRGFAMIRVVSPASVAVAESSCGWARETDPCVPW